MNNKIDNWCFFNPVRIINAKNGLENNLDLIPPGNALLVTSPSFTKNKITDKIISNLNSSNVTIYDQVAPNPQLQSIEESYNDFSANNFSCIIALGGGSVIDTAKALSFLLSNPSVSSLKDALTNNTTNKAFKRANLIAIPTTSGTGSEVTPFATIWDKSTGSKYSLNGEHIFPTTALLDPTLTQSLPYDTTLHSGLDAISHALESIWNINYSGITTEFAFESLRIALKHFQKTLSYPENIDSRAAMQLASSYAGIAISQTKTAIAHSISYPLTLHHDIPHGLAASFCLEFLIKHYIDTKKVIPAEKLGVLEGIKKIIASLKLVEKVLAYASRDEIIKLIPEMFDPNRAKNYSLPINEGFIKSVISNSI